MASQPYDVTVVIPTYNEGDRLLRVVRAVTAQAVSFPFEVLVIDAGSTDGSLRGLEEAVREQRPSSATRAVPPLRCLSIPHASFGHGQTRMLGARASRAPYVVFLVADAVPKGAHWLASLRTALETHQDAVAGTARQLPWPDADPALRRRLAVWTPEGDAVRRCSLAPEAREQVAQVLLERCVLDNVCAIYRRDYLLARPFADVHFGEDLVWAKARLLEGETLLYIPDAQVWHSHHRAFGAHVSRARVEHALLAQVLGVRRVRGVFPLLTQSFGLWLQALDQGLEGTLRLQGELLGQWLGGRDVSRR